MNDNSLVKDDESRQTLLENFLFPVRKLHQPKLEKLISGKTILITGASYGIGAELTAILSCYNVNMLLVARTKEKLEELKRVHQDKPCSISIHAIDLREEEQVNTFLQQIVSSGIPIDLFINNAGKSIHRGLDTSMGRFTDTQRCSATNYTGPVQLLMGLLPSLIERKGHIINVSAQNVLLPPTAGWSAYQSSKVAFDQWLRCMEPELRAKEVMVSSVYLPIVRTRMSMVNSKNHKKPSMNKDKAARAILNCVIHHKRKYRPWWTGIPLFAANLFPNLWYRLQVRHYKKKR